MTPEGVFSAANTLALLTWIAMIAAPRRPVVVDRIAGLLTPLLFSAAYVILVVTFWGTSSGGFSTLAGVAALFQNDWLLLAGWIHYLAFDLLIGRWELTDARARGIPHMVVVPCLLLTFLFGPCGWLVYRCVRAAWSARRA